MNALGRRTRLWAVMAALAAYLWLFVEVAGLCRDALAPWPFAQEVCYAACCMACWLILFCNMRKPLDWIERAKEKRPSLKT